MIYVYSTNIANLRTSKDHLPLLVLFFRANRSGTPQMRLPIRFQVADAGAAKRSRDRRVVGTCQLLVLAVWILQRETCSFITRGCGCGCCGCGCGCGGGCCYCCGCGCCCCGCGCCWLLLLLVVCCCWWWWLVVVGWLLLLLLGL